MWRVRRAQTAAWLLWSRSSIGQVRNQVTSAVAAARLHQGLAHNHGYSHSSKHRLLDRTVRHMATKVRRSAASAADDSASEEFSESDELEQENQDVKCLDEVQENKQLRAGDVEDTEDEGEGEGEVEEETGKEEHNDATKRARAPPRTFGKIDPFLSPKERELWIKVGAVQKGDPVVPIFEAWKNEGNELSEQLMAGIVGKLRQLTRFGVTKQVVEWMLENDTYKASWPALRATLIECVNRCHGMKAAEKYFQSLPAEDKTKALYDTMLAQFVAKGFVSKAEALFQEMEKADLVSGSAHAFNVMMRLYKRKGNNAKFQQMLDKAKAANVEPNIETYNVILDLKIKEGDYAAIEVVMDEIKDTPGIQPNAMTYLTIARSYVKAGHKEKAEVQLLRLENGPLKKTKLIYEIMMGLYADMGNKDEVDRMWSKSRPLPGDGANGYLTYMNALAKLGATDLVENMSKRIQSWKKTRTAEERRYNNLFTAYTVAGDTDKATEIENEMKEVGINVIKVQQQPARQAQQQPARQSQQPKKKKSEKNAGAEKSAGAEKNAGAEKSAGAEKNAGAEKKEKKAGTEKKEKKAGSVENFAERLSAAAEEGSVKKAEVVFDECRKARQSNVAMWNKLLEVYAKSDMPAYGFLQRMAADKVKPNEDTTKLLQEMDAL